MIRRRRRPARSDGWNQPSPAAGSHLYAAAQPSRRPDPEVAIPFRAGPTAVRPRTAAVLPVAAAVLAASACGDPFVAPGSGGEPRDGEAASFCLDSDFEILESGVRKDGIPALSDPRFVEPGSQGGVVADDAMVVGIVVEGEALAIPLSILRWHEIVNLDRTGSRVAVTYCPLTGTAMGFDRAAIGGSELGVSGLLVENNLIMYDRSSDESLWGQMLASAICGRLRGRTLPRVPVLELTFGAWRALHPGTRVASTDTGYDRDYTVNPYLDYDRLDAPPLFITDRNRDDRLPPKARVLGFPFEGGALAVPLAPLEKEAAAALHLTLADDAVVVLWDREARAAAAYRTEPVWAEGYAPPVFDALTFTPAEGGFVDGATGSVWTLDGRAVSGPAMGSRLEPVPDAVTAYWFAWAAFNAGSRILETPGGVSSGAGGQ